MSSSAFLNNAGKKLFQKHIEQYAPADPLYETYVDKRGKTKRRKRELPPGLSARDQKILRSVNRRAHYLDKGFRMCGMRFGWTFIIGIIPGAGDAADAALNYLLVVRKARQANIPDWLLTKMIMNNAVSVAIGLVPFAGDVALAMFKANSRNAALLDEFLRIRGEEFLKLQAAGKEPQVVVRKEQETKGKGKGKGKEVAGIKTSDVEQVKPGDGKAEGEVIVAQASSTVPGGLISVIDTSEADSAQPVDGPSKRRSMKRSWGSWLSGGAKTRLPPAGDQGRFVEDFKKEQDKDEH